MADSSLSLWKNFIESSIWQEMKKDILMRLSDIRDDLEMQNNSREQDLINKGRAEEARWLSEYPDLMIQELEQDLKEENK